MDAEFEASEWRACLISYASKFERNGFYNFCLAIEKVYLTQWVSGVRKDERFTHYSKILAAVETAKKSDEVLSGITFDKSSLQNATQRRDLYTVGFGKYMLLRLELVTAEHDVVHEFTARSVEHVLPQTPKSTGYWATHHDLSKISEYVDTIGNLVLLSKGNNSAASNLDFPDKKEKYLKSRVTDYPRSVQVLTYSDWDRVTIERRTIEASQLLLQDP